MVKTASSQTVGLVSKSLNVYDMGYDSDRSY
jgi:hypothetical protein